MLVNEASPEVVKHHLLGRSTSEDLLAPTKHKIKKWGKSIHVSGMDLPVSKESPLRQEDRYVCSVLAAAPEKFEEK